MRAFLDRVPFRRGGRAGSEAARLARPGGRCPSRAPRRPDLDTGRFRQSPERGLARSDEPLAARIVTTSPDVTVSTNLGAWVNRRGLFAREEIATCSVGAHPLHLHLGLLARRGQHLELGIAEMNLFLLCPGSACRIRCSASG
jgi:pyruvate dehydrogenase E1 component